MALNEKTLSASALHISSSYFLSKYLAQYTPIYIACVCNWHSLKSNIKKDNFLSKIESIWYQNSHMYSLYAVPYVTVWCSILLLSFVILKLFNECTRKTWVGIVSWRTSNLSGERAEEDNQEQLKETETTTYSEGKYSLKDQNDKKVENGNNIEIIDVKEDKV